MSSIRPTPARIAAGLADPLERRVRAFDRLLDAAVSVPSARIHSYVDDLRRRNPGADPATIIKFLESTYLKAVVGSSAAVGTAAALPGVGTVSGLALTGGDIAAYLAATTAFVLAIADVHGIDIDDRDRRRTLLLTTLLGERGPELAAQAAEVGGIRVGRTILESMPTSTLRKVNTQLGKRFIRRQLAKRTSLLMGRLVPFGVGAAIGAAGGRALAKSVISGAQAAFGLPPVAFAPQRPVLGASDRPA